MSRKTIFDVSDIFFYMLQFLSLREIHYLTLGNKRLFILRNNICDSYIGKTVFTRVRRENFVALLTPTFFSCFNLSYCYNQLHHAEETRIMRASLPKSKMNVINDGKEILIISYQAIIFCALTGNLLREASKAEITLYIPTKKSCVKKTDHRLLRIPNAKICCIANNNSYVFALYRNNRNELCLQKFAAPENVLRPPIHNSVSLFKEKPASSTSSTSEEKPALRKRGRE